MYQASKGAPWTIRIQSRDGDVIRASTGTADKETAKAVEAMVKHLKREHRHEAIDAIVKKKITLVDAYVAYTNERLNELLASLRDADLDVLVSEWAKGANERYVTQVRQLIRNGERFPASHFRRKTISVFLAELPVSGSTRNRYKAALSVFAKWLVEREVLDTNPVRDVKSSKPNPARMVWLSRKDARRLIEALPMPYKALEALMYGTGMEWSAIANTTRADVDVKAMKIHAKGGKTSYRNRNVLVTDAWAWKIFASHLKTLLPTAPLFNVKHDDALDVHHAAAKAVGLPKSTLHDWRHTFAVNSLKEGMDRQLVKQQLGHAPNSNVVEKVYGVYLPDLEQERRRKNG
jgi:integrase